MKNPTTTPRCDNRDCDLWADNRVSAVADLNHERSMYYCSEHTPDDADMSPYVIDDVRHIAMGRQETSTMAKRKPADRPYRVPGELAELAEARARAVRKRIGDHCTWTEIVRQILEAGLKRKGE